MHLAAWFYPRRWRNRYGVELHALMDDVAPRWRDVIDVMCGGLVMRWRMKNPMAMAGALAVAGALLGAIGALAAPASFESRGTMTATTADGANVSHAEKTLLTVMDRASASAFGPDDVPRAHIAVTRTAAPNEIQVAFVDADPERARRMTERLMTRAVEANLELAPAGGQSGLRLQITTPPDLPQSPSRPFLVWFIASGFAAGGLIGTAIGVHRRRTIQPGC